MVKRSLILAALISVTAVSLSFGSTTRLQTLRVGGFVEDDSDIFINPALVAYYPNLVIGELGTYSASSPYAKNGENLEDQWLGLTYGMETLAGGLVFNRDIPMVSGIENYPMYYSGYPFDYPIRPINPIEMMLAYESNGMAVGGRIYKIGAGHTDEQRVEDTTWTQYWRSDTKLTRGSGIWDFAGGFGMDLGGGNKLDAYGNIGLFSFSSEDEVTITWRDTLMAVDTSWTNATRDESEGGKYVGFGGRGFFSMNRRMRIVPLVEFSTMNFTEKAEEVYPDTTITSETENSEMSLKVGVGMNTRLARHTLLVCGVSFLYHSETTEPEEAGKRETTSWTLPLFQAGIETDLTKWFIARLGVQKAHAKITEKYTGEAGSRKQTYESTTTYSGSPLDFLSVGFGIKLDQLLIDATLIEEIPYTGTYLFSGISDNICGRITATYHF